MLASCLACPEASADNVIPVSTAGQVYALWRKDYTDNIINKIGFTSPEGKWLHMGPAMDPKVFNQILKLLPHKELFLTFEGGDFDKLIMQQLSLPPKDTPNGDAFLAFIYCGRNKVDYERLLADSGYPKAYYDLPKLLIKNADKLPAKHGDRVQVPPK
jgi:hypothetical protein